MASLSPPMVATTGLQIVSLSPGNNRGRKRKSQLSPQVDAESRDREISRVLDLLENLIRDYLDRTGRRQVKASVTISFTPGGFETAVEESSTDRYCYETSSWLPNRRIDYSEPDIFRQPLCDRLTRSRELLFLKLQSHPELFQNGDMGNDHYRLKLIFRQGIICWVEAIEAMKLHY